MLFRTAQVADIPQLQVVRHLVRENRLSDPRLVTDSDCEAYLTLRGKGWVCQVGSEIVGFSIVDVQDHNVWALFVHPDFEGKGIGKRLQEEMLRWYFHQTNETLWLSTAPGTRAVTFYQMQGWKQDGFSPGGEVRF